MQVYDCIGVPLRTFALTESKAGEALAVSFGSALNRLMTRMRQVHRGIEFAWVEHKAEAGKPYIDRKGVSRLTEGRFNRHMVVAGGDFIDAKWLNESWLRLYESSVSGLSEVKHPKGYAFYLASYLTKGEVEYRRCRFSDGWVFPGWFKWSKAYKGRFDSYPSVELLADMAMRFKSEIKSLKSYPEEVKHESLFLLASEFQGGRIDLTAAASQRG